MRIRVILSALLLMVLAACDQPPPEERLQSAGEQLENTADSIESLSLRIEDHEQMLAALKRERRQAEARLLTLEERVAARATDVALFRSVQSALLEEDALSQTAIAVDARQGTVTLTGTVSSEAQRERAVELAGETAGVSRLISNIDVEPQENRGGDGAS